MNHKELVDIGARWLLRSHDGNLFKDNQYRYSHPVVLKEMPSSDFAIPDVIGFCAEYSTVIECKISKQDFKHDNNKTHRHSLNEAGNYRYYLTPIALLNPNEINQKWGLLETDGINIFIKLTAPLNYEPEIKVAEYKILYSFARRKYSTLLKYSPSSPVEQGEK